MRKLLRGQARGIMKKKGYVKPNKCFRQNHWRELTNAYPTNLFTGKKMDPYYHGQKKQQYHDCCETGLWSYSKLR